MARYLYSMLLKIAPPVLRYTAVPVIKTIPRNSAAILSIHDYESVLLYDCLVKLKKNYHVLPLSRMIDDFYANRLDPRSVAITLDDGILIQVRTIAKILYDLQLPATFFVCPDFLDTEHVYWWEEIRLMLNFTPKKAIRFNNLIFSLKNRHERYAAFQKINRQFFGKSDQEIESLFKELRKATSLGREDLPTHHSIRMARSQDIQYLAKTGLFEIGSHSMDHPWLSLQSIDEIEYQLAGSKKRLELLVDKVSDCFCYPYGPRESINEATLKIARMHFRAAVTAQYGRIRPSDNPMMLNRVALMPGENYSVWESKINGAWKQVGRYF